HGKRGCIQQLQQFEYWERPAKQRPRSRVKTSPALEKKRATERSRHSLVFGGFFLRLLARTFQGGLEEVTLPGVQPPRS
ncbi:hypothetical protein VIGAN_UM075600, partial [Vigna angularis var. angularis]